MSQVLERGSVGERYRSSRLRLAATLSSIDEPSWGAAVAACPGWQVRDVLAHLVGVIEDALAGRIAGPPSPEQTAEEVARHRDDDPRVLLDQWTSTAPEFEGLLTALGLWPAFFDVLSHEHDIRGAIGDRSFRDDDDVLVAAGIVVESVPARIHVVLGDGEGRHRADPDVAVLRTTPFELFRLRLGRRSRAQVLAMDWTGDPMPELDGLFVFGPAAQDLDE